LKPTAAPWHGTGAVQTMWFSFTLALVGVVLVGCALQHPAAGGADVLRDGVDTSRFPEVLDADGGAAFDAEVVRPTTDVVERDATVPIGDGDVGDLGGEVDVPTDDADATVRDVDDGGCPPDRTRCGTLCADTRVDLQHCGGCGRACALNQTCDDGTCVCAPGTGDCDGVPSNGCETDLSTSTEHCGRCNNRCVAQPNSMPACVAGTCAPRCMTDFADCDGQETNGCEVDTRTDLQHCGGCGVACPQRPNAMATCRMGACGIACLSGFGDCDGVAANGCEEALQTSSLHCGSCSNPCSSGRACEGGTCATAASCMGSRVNCSGVCVDLTSDPRHCGRCGNPCGMGQTCVSGSCRCPSGQTVCSGVCTNPMTDRNHCGACGNACPAGASCVSGACRCPEGQMVCDGRCVDTRSNDAHCGRCNNACAVSGACLLSNCLCGGLDQVCCWFGRCGSGLRCRLVSCVRE
jgi:hypothetical protein